MSSSILELYDQNRSEKGTAIESEAKGKLISAIYSSHISVVSAKGNPTRDLANVIQKFRQIFAGDIHFKEYVALYVKHGRCFPHLFKSNTESSRVNRILELILLQNRSASGIEELLYCDSLKAVEDCIHTTLLAVMFYVDMSGITDMDRRHVIRTSCEILASIHTMNGKSFAKYLRCFLFWYFEEDSVNTKSNLLFRSYLRSSVDLLPASIYKELLTIVVEVVLECLAVKKKSTTKLDCESLIKRILDLVHISVAMEIISKSFLSSKFFRCRVSAIEFLDVTTAKLHQIRHNSYLNSSLPALQSGSSRFYEDQLDRAIEEEENCAGKIEQNWCAELDSMMQRGMVYIMDAGKCLCRLQLLNFNS